MYKLIQNDQVIDVVKYPRFVSFLPAGHIAITDKTSAHGIIGSDNKTIYSFETRANYPVVIIKEIALDELERLQGLLSSGQKPAVDDSTLAAIRNAVIKELSIICKYKITLGFSIVLSDNKVYNFRLTTEDQLNLMSIEGQLQAGTKTFVYHATNSPCQVFSREDMAKIINAFKRHILYHTTYFNVAKQYINSLLDIEVIKTFTYGADVSDTANDPIIKQILKNGGNLS